MPTLNISVLFQHFKEIPMRTLCALAALTALSLAAGDAAEAGCGPQGCNTGNGYSSGYGYGYGGYGYRFPTPYYGGYNYYNHGCQFGKGVQKALPATGVVG